MKKSFMIAAMLSTFIASGVGFSQLISSAGQPSEQHIVSSPKYGKPGASIELSYAIPKQIDPGQVLNIPIKLKASSDALRIDVASTDKVEVLSSESMERTLNSDGTVTIDVKAHMPNDDGMHYLYITAIELTQDGASQRARSFALPLELGVSNLKKQNSSMKTNGKIIESNGERIIEMIADPQ